MAWPKRGQGAGSSSGAGTGAAATESATTTATATTAAAAAAADSSPPPLLPLSNPPAANTTTTTTTTTTTQTPKPSTSTRLKSLLRSLLSACRRQWFLIALLLSVAFAAAVPQLGAKNGWLRAEYSVRIPAIVLIFLISGSGLKTAVLARAAGNLQAHALVQGVSLGATPLVGWAVGAALRASGGLPRPLADGIVVMSCMPTTISTNVVYTDMAGGNESIALVNAVLGNLVGIFISPAWITALVPAPPTSGHATTTADAAALQAAVPYASVLGELGYLVLAPLVAGQLLQFFAPKAVTKVRSKINLSDVSSFCIVLIVWISFCNTFSAARAGKGTPTTPRDAAAAFFLCAALLAVFSLVAIAASRLPVPKWERRSSKSGVVVEEEEEQEDGKKAAANANGTTTTSVVAVAALAAKAEEGRSASSAALNADEPASTADDNANTKSQGCLFSCQKLPRADAVAVIICGATKTLALGAPLISVMYGKSDDVGLVALPLVVYHALQCVVGAPLLGPLRRWRHGELDLSFGRCLQRRGRRQQQHAKADADAVAAAAPAPAQA